MYDLALELSIYVHCFSKNDIV